MSIMLADIHIFHQSDVYQIVDFKCHCNLCSLSAPEYNQSFCLSFIRHGFFEYRTFRQNNEMHVGRILLSKPGFEHTTRHIDHQPDITTVFEFTGTFFKQIQEQYAAEAGWFLLNNDIQSLILQCSAETEYLHHSIMQLILKKKLNELLMDEMVFQLLEKVLSVVGNIKEVNAIPGNLKKYHLTTMELARDYILQHFSENISLQQLAQQCAVSPFHLSRIFKSVMKCAPHQYLTEIRLQHANVSLGTTNKPVTDIAFDCGFNSVEHFATAYKQRFKVSPSQYRKQLA